MLAAASPGYWWFVVIFACGRPLLSATNALSEVIAAEQTDTQSRAKALAFVAAGYGVGAGCTAIIHSLASKTLGFRGLPWDYRFCVEARYFPERASSFLTLPESKNHGLKKPSVSARFRFPTPI